MNHLAVKDFQSLLKEQRPSTKWVIERIVNLCVHLVMITYPLGKPPRLPDYIKNNHYIIDLEKDKNNSYHLRTVYVSFIVWSLENINTPITTVTKKNQKAKELFQDYCQHIRVQPQDFEGVEMDDFPELEKYYEVQLFAIF